jgi:hypothetical protein
VKIHPTVWYVIVKNLIIGCGAYYLIGQNAALWWVALSGLLYSLVAVNSVLRLEERLNKGGKPMLPSSTERIEPTF